METSVLYPTADTYIVEGITGPLGTSTTLVGGQIIVVSNRVARILMRFNLGAFAGITLYSAVLRFALIDAEFLDGPHEVYCHELTKTDWVESQATYLNASTGNPWASAGGDFNATPFLTTEVSNGATSLSLNLLPLALLKRGGNMDLLIKLPEGIDHQDHFITAWSRETTVLANRPALTIEHALPTGAPLQWDALGYGPLHWSTVGTEPPPLEWNEIASRPVHWS